MESAAVNQDRKGRLVRMLCDILGVLLGLVFLAAGIWILDGNREPNVTFDRSMEGVMQRGLIVATLLFVSICLALPTKLYWDRRLRTAGQIAASMTSAVTLASAVLPLVVLLLLCVIDPPSPGTPAHDGGGVLIIISAAIGLAAFLVFLPCTYVLVRKATMRLAHLAIGTVVAGAIGGLVIYLCY